MVVIRTHCVPLRQEQLCKSQPSANIGYQYTVNVNYSDVFMTGLVLRR